VTTVDGVSEARAERSRLGLVQYLGSRYGLILLWVAMAITFTILAPGRFLTSQNVGNVFGSQAVLVVVAMGLLFAVVAGEWDLSVGATLGLSLTLVGKLNGVQGWNIWLVVVIAVLAGVLVGLANACFIVLADVPSLIATLGMATLLAGVTYGISNVTVAGLDETFVELGQQRFLEIPLPFYYCLLIALATWYVLKWTPFGRHLYFVGAGREVARLSGIRVGRVRTLALVSSATLSALAGVLLAASLGATGPSIGATYLLPAFAAVFLGATTIAPGHLNVWGAVVAVYFLITGITGLQILGAESYIQQIFYGGILLVAVAVSRQAKDRS
jgi:ribose transport system permease protein